MNANPVFLEQCYITPRAAQLAISLDDSRKGPPLSAVALPFLVSRDESAVMALKKPVGGFSFPTLQMLSTEMPWRTAMAAFSSLPLQGNGLKNVKAELLRSGHEITYLTADEIHTFKGRVVAHVPERCVDIVYPIRVELESLEVLDGEENVLLMPWRGVAPIVRDFSGVLLPRDVKNLQLGGDPLPTGWIPRKAG